MQYTLTQASAMAIPVLEPVDFQTLQTNYQEKQEQIPNLHIEHYTIYEQHELQDTEEEIQHQEEGARPKDPFPPWSLQPFGRRTQSQASFAKRRARQELYRQSKCQQQHWQVLITSAVQATLVEDTVPFTLKPYAENKSHYHPFTGTGCSGLSEEEEVILEDDCAQPSSASAHTACDSVTPNMTDVSEEFKVIIRNIHSRGITPRSVHDSQVSTVRGRSLSHITSMPIPPVDDDTFQDADEDD